MSTTIHWTSPASAHAAAPDRLTATVDDREVNEYRRGREHGLVWARDYATADEVRDIVENFRPVRGGDFDNPHWRGFTAGAEEVLDAISPLLNT